MYLYPSAFVICQFGQKVKTNPFFYRFNCTYFYGFGVSTPQRFCKNVIIKQQAVYYCELDRCTAYAYQTQQANFSYLSVGALFLSPSPDAVVIHWKSRPFANRRAQVWLPLSRVRSTRARRSTFQRRLNGLSRCPPVPLSLPLPHLCASRKVLLRKYSSLSLRDSIFIRS